MMNRARMLRDLPIATQWLSLQLMGGESLPLALQRCTLRNCGALAGVLNTLSSRCCAGMALSEALTGLRAEWAGTSLATLAIALQAGQRQRAQLAPELLRWSVRLRAQQRTQSTRRWQRLRRGLVVGMVALAALLIGGLLLLASMRDLLREHAVSMAVAWLISLTAGLLLARRPPRCDA